MLQHLQLIKPKNVLQIWLYTNCKKKKKKKKTIQQKDKKLFF